MEYWLDNHSRVLEYCGKKCFYSADIYVECQKNTQSSSSDFKIIEEIDLDRIKILYLSLSKDLIDKLFSSLIQKRVYMEIVKILDNASQRMQLVNIRIVSEEKLSKNILFEIVEKVKVKASDTFCL